MARDAVDVAHAAGQAANEARALEMLIECTRPRGDLERAREALRAARYGQPLGERL